MIYIPTPVTMRRQEGPQERDIIGKDKIQEKDVEQRKHHTSAYLPRLP